MKKLLPIILVFCSFALNAENRIKFTTTKSAGESIFLNISAFYTNQADVWIDLNNNGVKDVDESVSNFNVYPPVEYIVNSDTITIYGKVNSFSCPNQEITSVDVSKNSFLEGFFAPLNKIESLDVSHNPNLIKLLINNNKLDDLSLLNNPNLELLYCGHNTISSLNLDNNLKLTTLDCENNNLTELDCSSQSKLSELRCDSNAITQLNISLNTQLTFLSCFANELSILDVSNCNQLNYLDCVNNHLTTLDITANSLLTEFYAATNSLTSLNVANGNNVSLEYLEVDYNPELKCIQIDSNFTPSEDWWKDDSANWSDTPCDKITNLGTQNKESVEILVEDHRLIVSNLMKNQKIFIMNASGKVITGENVTSSTFSAEIPTGFYIIKIDNDSYKIIVGE